MGIGGRQVAIVATFFFLVFVLVAVRPWAEVERSRAMERSASNALDLENAAGLAEAKAEAIAKAVERRLRLSPLACNPVEAAKGMPTSESPTSLMQAPVAAAQTDSNMSEPQWCMLIPHAQHRRSAAYPRMLLKTLSAFTTAEQKRRIKVILILTGGCDLDTQSFKAVEPDWIQVECIAQPHPQLEELKPERRTAPPAFGDTLDRELWRSTMALDFAYGLDLCKGAPVIIHVEDDMIASWGYMTEIEKFIQQKRASANNGDYSNFAFLALYNINMPPTFMTTCGKPMYGARAFLINGQHADGLAEYVRSRFSTSPHDWMVRDYFAGRCAYVHYPSLFEHTGIKSTSHADDRPEVTVTFNQWGEPKLG